MTEMKEGNKEIRAAIMGRVRQQLAAVTRVDAATRRKIAETAIGAQMRGPQPGTFSDLPELFRRKVEAMSSTTDRVASRDEAPQAVARYLAANGLGAQAVVSLEVAELDWSGAGLSVAVRSAADADQVGITGCFCAIAETGTLMMVSAPNSPPTLSLLPETHVALVPVECVLPSIENGFFLLRQKYEAMPPAVNFISGPSRTADIEQTIVLGAHGPCRVHVILIG